MANKVFKTKYQTSTKKLVNPKVKLVAIASLVTCLFVGAGYGAYQLVSSTPSTKFEQSPPRVTSVKADASAPTRQSPQSFFDQQSSKATTSVTPTKKKKSNVAYKKHSKKKSISKSKNKKSKNQLAKHKTKKSKHSASLKKKNKHSLAKKKMTEKKHKKTTQKGTKKAGKNIVSK